MVPEPLVQQFKQKRWGSGDENGVSPEVKNNAQKRSTFHRIAHTVLDSQWKKRYFWMVPVTLVQQFKKKSWGSGDENIV